MMCPCQRHSDTLWDLCTILIISRQRLALSLISLNTTWGNSYVVCSDTMLNWARSQHEKVRQRGGISPVMAPSQIWNRCGETPRVYRRGVFLTVIFSVTTGLVSMIVSCPRLLWTNLRSAKP